MDDIGRLLGGLDASGANPGASASIAGLAQAVQAELHRLDVSSPRKNRLVQLIEVVLEMHQERFDRRQAVGQRTIFGHGTRNNERAGRGCWTHNRAFERGCHRKASGGSTRSTFGNGRRSGDDDARFPEFLLWTWPRGGFGL